MPDLLPQSAIAAGFYPVSGIISTTSNGTGGLAQSVLLHHRVCFAMPVKRVNEIHLSDMTS
jgi:hypothetical protein